jgi:hypothetical protein
MVRSFPTRQIAPIAALLVTLFLAPVALANEPPVIIAPTALQRDPGNSIFLTVNTSDPDGDHVTLAGANVPPGARFLLDGNGNGTLLWTPKVTDVGFYVFTLIATDDGDPVESVTHDIAITIGNPNVPPVLDPIGDQMATVGMPLVVALSASDAEGAPLVFSLAAPLSGSLLVAETDTTATFEYVPGAGDVGNKIVTFVVSDGIGTDEETIVISVGAVNVPPMLEPIGDRQLVLGEMLAIALMADDADGDGLSFEADGLPEGVSLTDRGDGTAELTGTPLSAGVYLVTVTVTDDGAPPEAALETFEIDVQSPPEDAELVILHAEWTRHTLAILGEGALPDASVMLRDPVTGALLGNVMADASGSYAVKLRPFVPPCSVEASADEATSPVVAVENAPAYARQNRSASCGNAFVNFWRLNRSSGAPAITRPSRRIAADELISPWLSPTTSIEYLSRQPTD